MAVFNWPHPNNPGAEDEDAWFDIWEEGLEKADLAKAFSKVGPAFIFGPQSPSFMQDFDQLEGEAVPLGRASSGISG